jgi:hypothetical protein
LAIASVNHHSRAARAEKHDVLKYHMLTSAKDPTIAITCNSRRNAVATADEDRLLACALQSIDHLRNMESGWKDDFIARLHLGKDVLPRLSGLHKKLASACNVGRRHGARLRATRSGLRACSRNERWWNNG